MMRPDEFISVIRSQFHQDPEPFFQNEFVLELLFWLVSFGLTLLFLKFWPHWLEKIEKCGKQFARKKGRTVAVIVFLSLGLRVALLPFVPIPEPEVHDEYSYLLQAATFASGRLTNPTPAGWTHFETFHVNMVPTYQSMYPPVQALFLAGAEVLHLHPWWGVWFSVGLMCGTVCWMLQGWVPPQWALLGGLFCVVRFSIFSYWINSYFGGAVAAAGGALVFGALPRLKQGWKPRYGIILAIGLGLMANTRAYEGFVFSVPAIIALLWWFFSAHKRHKAKLTALIPGVAVLLLIAAGMGYYNWRNTGNPLLLPYVVNQRQYHITKPFIWQARYPIPNYRHQMMRTFYVYHELPDYLSRRTPGFYWGNACLKFEVYYDFFVWPLLIPFIFAFWAMMKSRRMQLVPITLLVTLAGLLLEQWPPEGHYAAPILTVVTIAVLYALRLLWIWKPRQIQLGPMLVRSVVILVFLWSLAETGKMMYDPYDLYSFAELKGPVHAIWTPVNLERSRIQAQLEHTPGQHIIFVHFHGRELPGIFWIFNDPDISHSKIIWTYDMGEEANQELIRLYPNRHLWIVDKNNFLEPVLPYHHSDHVAETIIAKGVPYE